MPCLSLVDSLRKSSGVPTGSYDVACGKRAAEALLYYGTGTQPLHGHVVLFSSHLILTGITGGKVLFVVALSAVKGLRCTGRMLFSGKSFDCPTNENAFSIFLDEVPESATEAQKIVFLDIFVEGAAVTMKMLGWTGEQFARSVMILWRLLHNKMEAISVPLYHPGDAVYALAGAPVRLSGTLSHFVSVKKSCSLEDGAAVDILMFNEKEIYIVRKPREAVMSWHNFKRNDSKNFELLSVDSLSALAFPLSTSLKLVSSHGDIWTFEIPNPATDPAVFHALQRLIELFLLGMLRSNVHHNLTEPLCGLRHFDLVALFHQYSALDEGGAGHVLWSSLEAAMGPLLVCDTRLVRAMSCRDESEDGNAASNSGKVSLAMYVNHMWTLLQGSTLERAKIAFRAFGGSECLSETAGEGNEINKSGKKKDVKQQQGNVRLLDFKQIARDILTGLRFKPLNKDETIDDTLEDILRVVHEGSEGAAESMTFPTFLQVYTRMIERLEESAKTEHTISYAYGVSQPLLSFASQQWIPLTYLLTGVEVSALAAVHASGHNEKNTFDLRNGTPNIASVNSIISTGATGETPSFFRRRIQSANNDCVTFTDYEPAVFATIRMHFGVDMDIFLDALGISTLRARLLLGQLCAPRDFRSSGRSGALMISSHDHRFVLKRVTHTESQTLRNLLPSYVAHLERYQHTLLPRYAGLYALWRCGEKNAFVITENIFAPAQLPIMMVYDLKGSTFRRSTPVEDRRLGAAGKDNDFLSEKKRLRIPTESRDALLAQLEADTQLLEEANRLDYSLLVGIHTASSTFASSEKAVELALQQRRRMSALTLALKAQQGQKSTGGFDNKNNSVFCTYYGGLASTDGSEVYYLGIVDCLTVYDLKKVGEHYGKSVLMQDMKEVSCAPPPVYRSRFMNFMRSIIEE